MTPPTAVEQQHYLALAIAEAVRGARAGEGGPFGAVVVRGGQVIASAANAVVATNDPTAHAEVQVIRKACAALGSFQLEGCDIYASCEPCPMCLGAILWARPRAVYYAATRAEAAAAGFDDALFHATLAGADGACSLLRRQIACSDAATPFSVYATLPGRTRY